MIYCIVIEEYYKNLTKYGILFLEYKLLLTEYCISFRED